MKTKLLITALVALSLLGCHILQKDKLTLKKLSQKEELQFAVQRNTLSLQSQLVLIDSSYNDFTVLLYPKGKFAFSIANGFEGEADKILIKGKNTSQKKLDLKQEIRKDSTATKANYTTMNESVITVKKNKLSTGYNWGWVAGLLVVFTLIWLYRRLKQ
ncbi:MAG: hypothetical protein V4663_16665 [Bacteroidota bacterium]